MMFRFSPLIAALLCACSAQAERTLTRTQLEPMLRANAVCYVSTSDTCYSGEYYDITKSGDITITYAFYDGADILVVRERAFWQGDTLCVAQSANGIVAAWDLYAPDRSFRFDLANADPRSGFEVAQMHASFGAGRPPVYCYGFIAGGENGRDLSSYFVDDAVPGSGAKVRLVPRSAGSMTLE